MGEDSRESEHERQPVRRGGLVGPALLVGAGAILLLNNLGVLDWGIWWSIVRLWPLVLVAIGIDLLIGRRSVWGALLALVLILAVLGGGFWLAYSGALTARQLPTQEISQELGGATEASIVLDPGAGDVRVQALTDSANLVEAALRRVGAERFEKDYSVSAGRAVFTLQSVGAMWWSPTSAGGGAQPTWDVGVNADVPVDLQLNLGAGTCKLDLTNTTLHSVTVDLGLGRCEIAFPSQGRIQGTISGAIGETVIIIPAGMEARIEVSSGIAARQIPEDFEQRDDVYVTPGYQGADNILDLVVSQALGRLRIRRAIGF